MIIENSAAGEISGRIPISACGASVKFIHFDT